MSEVCRITVHFADDENPWEYPLALNGRTIERVTFGGVEYTPANVSRVVANVTLSQEQLAEMVRDVTKRVNEYAPVSECVLEYRDCGNGFCAWHCSECGSYVGKYDNYCPNCGARVRGGGDD